MPTIEQVVVRRGIRGLPHFTRLENVDSILQFGLIPRAHLSRLAKAPMVNDEIRLDRHPEANCLSISFPNWRMFWKCRCDAPSAEWAVLVLDPAVLRAHDCAFCTSNAAQAAIAGVPLEDRKGGEALERLFEEVPGKPSRSELGLPDSFTTDPQAEVLVFGWIDAGLIQEIWTENVAMATRLRERHPAQKIAAGDSFFRQRHDYEYWTQAADAGIPSTPTTVASQPGAPPARRAVVRNGSIVVLGDGRTITIGKTCTVHSPVGQALLGHTVGETVTALLPGGRAAKMKIVEVQTP